MVSAEVHQLGFSVNAVLDLIVTGYDISLEIPDETSLTDTQLCIIFGNLLENAIEACCRTENENRFIKLSSNIKAGMLYIAMDNSCDGNIRIENGGFISSKRNEIGTGINSITAIVKKYFKRFFYVIHFNYIALINLYFVFIF